MKGKITKKNTKGKHTKNKQTRNKKYIKIKLKKQTKKYTKKNRNNKKGGLKVVEEETFTKKNYRWKNNKTKYDSLKKTSCDNIYNYKDLSERLRNNFISKTNLKVHENTYTLFPYCSEKIKGMGSLDKVNSPFTSLEALHSLHNVFQCNFLPKSPAAIEGDYTSIENLSKSKGASSPKNDPQMFLRLLSEFNKNCFIVSHSGFMKKLYDYILRRDFINKTGNYEDTYYDESNIDNMISGKFSGGAEDKEREYGVFDNLDILQIILDNKGSIHYVLIRRYSTNYKLDDNDIKKYYENSTLKSVFIMRHCLGCHNVTPGTITKIGQGFKQAITGQNFGYLDWSLCFEDTVDDMNVVGKDLYNLLESYGGFQSYIFGSSVIFRAMLTCILMYNIISNIESVSEEQNIVSGLQEPKDPESPN